ncbi:MAG: hypothetical protein IPH39_18850 [Sulfuritalea sp.]|nr:hypothetical protein [Sulfuritalea sp.]
MRRDLDVIGALGADFLDLGAEEAKAILAFDAALMTVVPMSVAKRLMMFSRRFGAGRSATLAAWLVAGRYSSTSGT